jgi:O-methyltransferase
MNRPTQMLSRALSLLGSAPIVLAFLCDPEVGCAYRVGFLAKLRLLIQFRRNTQRVATLSHIREHLELARALLAVPPELRGDVVECGCYLGGSSVNISLVCALTGRRLLIYDSFEGLPEPSAHDRVHENLNQGYPDEYFKGRFAASLETVRDNLRRFGSLESCELIQGFFDQTLPGTGRDVVMAFLDVDLIDSLQPCLIGLWPKTREGCRVYVHEASSLSLIALFFDHGWWQKSVHEPAPGFVGSGSGLPLALRGSELGYAQKGTHLVAPAA